MNKPTRTAKVPPTENPLESILGSIEARPNESPDLDSEIEEAIATELSARYGS